MIPIRDTIPTKNFPVINWILIGINILVFIIQLSQGENLFHFNIKYGLVPIRYTNPEIAHYFSFGQQLFSLVSFMFLHGGFWHLLGNMWSLYIFGDNVEDRLGPIRYLVFYLLCGITSGLSHLVLNLNSDLPTIGASGAIAGVMGAYLILHPNSKILTLIPIIFIPWFIEIPAFFFLGFWFIMQFISAAGTADGSGGIAWWAHIGGFIFGILFLKIFLLLPEVGLTGKTRKITKKKKTHRFQVIRPAAPEADTHLYGAISISPYEAKMGSTKHINIPWGFHKRLIRVTIPPGMKDGQSLRLKGLGRIVENGERGDLYLKVTVR